MTGFDQFNEEQKQILDDALSVFDRNIELSADRRVSLEVLQNQLRESKTEGEF